MDHIGKANTKLSSTKMFCHRNSDQYAKSLSHHSDAKLNVKSSSEQSQDEHGMMRTKTQHIRNRIHEDGANHIQARPTPSCVPAPNK